MQLRLGPRVCQARTGQLYGETDWLNLRSPAELTATAELCYGANVLLESRSHLPTQPGYNLFFPQTSNSNSGLPYLEGKRLSCQYKIGHRFESREFNMPCTGRCFNIEPLKSDPIPMVNDGEEQPQMLASVRTRAPFTYTPLMPWQTRVLRLHSATKCSAHGVSTRGQLQADLLVVNLILKSGIVAVEGTNEMISYNALSYTWGRPKLSYTLICNGAEKLISLENATAMKALQKPNDAIYLWIDAICINQDDLQEKSAQVAQMLAIFQKAESVIAWLGDSDDESLLAFAVFAHLNAEWSTASADSHTITCQEQLRLVYDALLSVCSRPWFSRTWVRQEIYGARQLSMRCGTHEVTWKDFIDAVGTIDAIASSSDSGPELGLMSHALLDAKMNAEFPVRGDKPSRNLLEVLLSSINFNLADEKDTVYAILGMCGISTTTAKVTEASTIRQNTSLASFAVDYSKSIIEIYCDATLYIVNRAGRELKDLADLWHSYKRSPRHERELPSWAVDWRSGLLDSSEQSTIVHNMRVECNPESRFWEALSTNHTNALAPIPQPPVDIDGHELPVWHWPQPHAFDRRILEVKARVINYVAYLTNFTWQLDDFISKEVMFWGRTPIFWPRKYEIGLAGQMIHASDRPRQDTYLLNELPSTVTAFTQGTHTWRLAILGLGHLQQLSLVPATTKKGDLVIAIGPGLLPMVVHPIQGNGTAGGLFKVKDPYEDVAIGKSASIEMDDRLAIALRRRAVLAHLDEIVKNVGKDFEFHGPMFARTETNRFEAQFPVSKLSFTRAVFSSNLIRKRPHIKHTDITNLFRESFCSNPLTMKDTSINERPLQELLLH